MNRIKLSVNICFQRLSAPCISSAPLDGGRWLRAWLTHLNRICDARPFVIALIISLVNDLQADARERSRQIRPIDRDRARIHVLIGTMGQDDP